jgi:tetratricopeptide (TPR) repeat protein
MRAHSAVQINSNDAEAHFLLGELYTARGDEQGAYDAYRRAVNVDPTLLAAQAAIGALYLQRQEYVQAVLSYRRLTNGLPTNAGAHYNLALALWGQGFKGQAVDALRQARRLYERQEDLQGVDRVDALLEFWNVAELSSS